MVANATAGRRKRAGGIRPRSAAIAASLIGALGAVLASVGIASGESPAAPDLWAGARLELAPPPAEAPRANAEAPGSIVGFARSLAGADGRLPSERSLLWTPTADGGQTATLAILSPGAAALRVQVVPAVIPPGTRVHFFAPDGPSLAGALDDSALAALAREGRAYWSPTIPGDAIGIEISVPWPARAERLRLSLPRVSHLVQAALGAPASQCPAATAHAACSAGQDEPPGAVGVRVTDSEGRTAICAGTALAAKRDGRADAYVLTARSCVPTPEDAATVELLWADAACDEPGRFRVQRGGASLLASDESLGFSLLRPAGTRPDGTTLSPWSDAPEPSSALAAAVLGERVWSVATGVATPEAGRPGVDAAVSFPAWSPAPALPGAGVWAGPPDARVLVGMVTDPAPACGEPTKPVPFLRMAHILAAATLADAPLTDAALAQGPLVALVHAGDAPAGTVLRTSAGSPAASGVASVAATDRAAPVRTVSTETDEQPRFSGFSLRPGGRADLAVPLHAGMVVGLADYSGGGFAIAATPEEGTGVTGALLRMTPYGSAGGYHSPYTVRHYPAGTVFHMHPGTYWISATPVERVHWGKAQNPVGPETALAFSVSSGKSDPDRGPAGGKDLGTVAQAAVAATEAGSLDGVDDLVDYFTLRLDAASQLEVTLEELDFDADLSLESPDGYTVYRSTGSGTSDETIDEHVAAGTWHVRVEARAEGDNDYVLGYDATDPGTDALSTDSSLTALSLTDVDDLAFASATTSYTVSAPREAPVTTVSATAAAGATVRIEPADADERIVGHQVGLRPGATTEISVVVTAADGSTTTTYTVAVQKPAAEIGELRVRGARPWTGRLEMFLDVGWKVVCDDYFANHDALVACRQLGYPNAAHALDPAVYGGTPVVDDVDCIGLEAKLTDCEYVRPSDCRVGEAAGLFCSEAALPFDVEITPLEEGVYEGTALRFAVSRTGDLAHSVTVHLHVAETGDTLGEAPETALIAAGEAVRVLSVPTVGDLAAEAVSEVTMAVAYVNVGSHTMAWASDASATAAVLDDDAPDADAVRGGAVDLGTVAVADAAGSHNGMLDGGRDVTDYFLLTLATSARLSLTLTGLDHDADLTVEDANGDAVYTSSADGVADESINELFAAGTWYVRVSAVEPGMNGYALGYDATALVAGEALGTDATLTSLALDGVDIGTFSAATHAYHASVTHDLAVTTVTAVAAGGAAANVTPVDTNGAAAGHQVELEGGADTLITIVVTAADRTTTTTYTVTVNRAAPPNAVTALTLVNATGGPPDPDLLEIAEGATLDLTGATWYSIRADIESGHGVRSVRFRLSGAKRRDHTERIPPYSLAGDGGWSDYYGMNFPNGSYRLVATAYAEAGVAGTELGRIERNFTVTGSFAADAAPVTGFKVFSSGTEAGAIADGGTIDISMLAQHQMDFRAELASSPAVGSVHLLLNGPTFGERVVNASPYALFGGDGVPLNNGAHTLKATPYIETDGRGHALTPLTVAFTVSGGDTTVPAADIPDDTSTTATLRAGQSLLGRIDPVHDRDWYRVEFEAGTTYVIDLEGASTNAGTLHNPLLRWLHDADGNGIRHTRDDNDGTGLNARQRYTAPTTGTYYVSASAATANTGTFKLSMRIE